MNLVTLRDVSVAYDGYEALRHVDLEIADLDFLGVIGPNGGGKTTLVKAILGTVPHTGELTLAPGAVHFRPVGWDRRCPDPGREPLPCG